jgi:hypothetical protein
MSYGIIEYDDNGKPICEICKKSFDRVISHVRQKHQISEYEYKIIFGFDLGKGICSKESAKKTRIKTFSNYNKCINKNLIISGIQTRFNKGCNGRTKDMVQEQTRLMLKKRLKESKMIEAMKKSGYIVGKTGLGNKTRWSKLTTLK